MLDASAFKCGICLELQYKPCVNACGHSFCFWCFHQAMDYLNTTHACPLCRAPFRHFPAVCAPLHLYLARRFPEEMKVREEETAKQEREEFHAESPDLPLFDKAFSCVECDGLACPPAVLSCGHVVCRGSGEKIRQKKICPVGGCCGTTMAGESASPAVCAAIDAILRQKPKEKYEADAAASADRCAGLHAETTVPESTSETNVHASRSFAPNDAVVIRGLTSAKGSQLNGRHATITSYCESSGRYAIRVPSMQDFECQVKAENLVGESEAYVHFGVGCDGCGEFPIIGRRFKCNDCSEEIGVDLCGSCFDSGVHEREAGVGRFNQDHRPGHSMEEMEQPHTILHELRRRHPDTPLSQIVEMINMQSGDVDEDDGSGDGEPANR
ncbi:hypothetical protein ACHAXT_003352 [Thalassiosira profunda]